VKSAGQTPLRIKQNRDDPHGLLRVVSAMCQAQERGRDELKHAEAPVDGKRRRPHKDRCDYDGQRQQHADHRRQHDRGAYRAETFPDHRAGSGFGDVRADQGVAAA
jgi:hypothetical protein